jgi:hypothetical protein
MVELVCGLEEKRKLEAIPLSDDVICSRIVDISFNILKHVTEELAASPSPFIMHLDEATDISQCNQLFVSVHSVHADTIKEQFLFCESLFETTKAVDIMVMAKIFAKKFE